MDPRIYKELVDNNTYQDPTFKIVKNQLYKLKDGKLLKVIQKFEVPGILYLMHDFESSGHFGIQATIDRIIRKFF